MIRHALLTVLLFSPYAAAQPKKAVNAKDGSGVFGYKHTPVQPWSGYHVHDPDRPNPPRVETASGIPSDAVVLFDGKDLSQWEPSEWKLGDGYVEAAGGSLRSKRQFADCQIHVEWRTPGPPTGDIMNRGNNGVMLMGVYEIQIFDSYSVKIYPDGQAGSVYGQTPPYVNATRKPGEWQTYDIVFFAPKWKDGNLEQPPRVTAFHNGVLILHNQEIFGGVAHAKFPTPHRAGMTEGPLSFSGHHNPVRLRNIWVRPLAVR